MNILRFGFLVLLISCGGRDSGSGVASGQPETNRPSICSELNLKCFGIADWTVNSKADDFPQGFQLLLDDRVMFDSCQFPNSIKAVTDGSGRILIRFTLPLIPETALKMGIIDCFKNTVFHSEDDVLFETGFGDGENYEVNVFLKN